MRVAVLGAAGQLGRDLVARLGAAAVPLTRAEIDLSRPETAAAGLVAAGCPVVVNCAAYNFVDKAESEPDAAFAVNAWGVRALALACGAVGAKLVHVSTDYVFGLDAARREPLTEECPPGPVSVYGASKLVGEYMARSLCPRHLVVRTCGLYGAWGTGGKGGNFVETMLRVASQGKPLRVVADQHCTPTSTADLAATLAALIAADATGLVHATNAGAATWHVFAAEIFRQAGVRADLTPIPSGDYPLPAKRPPYSVLDGSRLRRLGAPMRPWREALADYLRARRARQTAIQS